MKGTWVQVITNRTCLFVRWKKRCRVLCSNFALNQKLDLLSLRSLYSKRHKKLLIISEVLGKFEKVLCSFFVFKKGETRNYFFDCAWEQFFVINFLNSLKIFSCTTNFLLREKRALFVYIMTSFTITTEMHLNSFKYPSLLECLKNNGMLSCEQIASFSSKILVESGKIGL